MTKNPTDRARIDWFSKDCGRLVVASAGKWFARSKPSEAHEIDRWISTKDLREAIDAAMRQERREGGRR